MPPPRLLSLILTAAGLSACVTEAEVCDICVDVAEDEDFCPEASEIDDRDVYVEFACLGYVESTSVSGLGQFRDRWGPGSDDLVCCYEGTMEAVDGDAAVGRPFVQDNCSAVASVAYAHGWSKADTCDANRASPQLTPTQRRAWANAALAEHASVAAFSRLSLELMAHGAPAALIRAAHQAALDEVDHAERCFELASLPHQPVAPGPFPFARPLDLTRPLAEVAADAVREGCVGETMGAILARAAAERANDPDIASVLAGIADDEERHAAFSWQVVAWAQRVGGEPVRQAVNAAFREPPPRMDVAELSLRSGVPAEQLLAALAAGARGVVGPATRALLSMPRS